MDDPTSRPSENAEAELRPTAPSRMRASRSPALRVGVIVGLVLLFLVAADAITSSPALCGSCHAMKPRAARWAESAHAEISCVECHETPTAWYALPKRVAARAGSLARDVRWQWFGRSAEAEPRGAEAIVSSASCLACHDPNRQATSGFRILINHAEHAKRNGSCLSCHVNTGHPEESRGRALSLMDQCFNCHGAAEEPDASADCDVCHPSDYELVPATHKPKAWPRAHGGLAKSDPTQCDLCHEQAFCKDCHGLAMPHPEGWARGRQGHAVVAEQNRQVCVQCHREKPDFCSMCHHEAYDPTKGDWVKQHYLEVDRRGAAFCFECHAATFCVRCHASQPS